VKFGLLRVKKNHECGYLRDTGTFVVRIVALKEQEIELCGLRPAIFPLNLKQSLAPVNSILLESGRMAAGAGWNHHWCFPVSVDI